MKVAIRFFILALAFAGIAQIANAQNKQAAVPTGAQKAQVINDGAMVYKNPDFDAPVMTYLQAGKVFFVSLKLFNEAFYKIKLANNSFGYIADTDVRVAHNASSPEASKPKGRKALKSESRPRKKRSFVSTRFTGIALANVAFKEDTVGRIETDNMLFYGVKISGPNLLVDGDTPTEINFMFHSGAPKYYESLTGNSASGFVALIDGLFVTPFDEGFNRAFYFGFGPLLRYSKFAVKLTTVDLDMQDMRLGAAFDLGLGVRISNVAIRCEAKYYWEREKYLSLGASLQF